MAWIWIRPEEDDDKLVWSEYDQKSTFRSSLVLARRPIPLDSGQAILRVAGHKLAKVQRYQCLPSDCSAPVVNGAMAGLISSLVTPLEVQFYPVTVIASDRSTCDYQFAVPLNQIACVDIQRSSITSWIVPEKSALSYDAIQHKSNCLGELNYARDSVLSHVLVSARLKSLLEQTGDPGLAFLQPERMRDFDRKLRSWIAR